jgi:hypothetical protein
MTAWAVFLTPPKPRPKYYYPSMFFARRDDFMPLKS